jgi:hypothetical protein
MHSTYRSIKKILRVNGLQHFYTTFKGEIVRWAQVHLNNYVGVADYIFIKFVL